jgi:ABC-type amino acid transport substrate-binding protein
VAAVLLLAALAAATPAAAMQRLHEASMKLATLRDRLGAAADGRPVPPFAVVYIVSMLWSRFEADGERLVMTPHAHGPAPDDVVIVTDEPVVDALLDGRVTPQAARQLGLLRLYGAPGRTARVEARLDALAAGGSGG